MANIEKHAQVVWTGSLGEGSGQIVASSSKALDSLGISWQARALGSDALTSPEEMLAAAHASCFAMAMSAGLGRRQLSAERIEVTAACGFSLGEGGAFISSMRLSVRASIAGISSQDFQALAEETKETCPVSRALKGNVPITLESVQLG